MGAPIVYRFDDDGAPALTSADNTKFINLLKACLVDGYGGKPGAGWTMPYISDNGDKAAFRNNPAAGTGFYMQVSYPNADNHLPCIRAYESMSSVDDGVNPFYADTDNLKGIAISGGRNQTIARPWLLVADDRLFWFVCWIEDTYTSTNRSNIKMLCFGDGIPFNASDRYFCVLFLSNRTVSHYQNFTVGYGNPAATTNEYKFTARNISGDVGIASCEFIHGGGPFLASSFTGARAQDQALPRILGSEIISRPYVNDGTAYSFRGYVPGLWHPCHKVSDFNNFEQIEINGHRFIIVKQENGSYNYLLALDISEHWRP